jgi:hypothetical protein
MLDLQRLIIFCVAMPDSFSFALSRLYPSFNSVSLAIRAPSDSAVCMSFEFVDKRRVGYEQFFVLISTGFYLVQLFGIDCLKAVQL